MMNRKFFLFHISYFLFALPFNVGATLMVNAADAVCFAVGNELKGLGQVLKVDGIVFRTKKLFLQKI